jgi:hypothetical protein
MALVHGHARNTDKRYQVVLPGQGGTRVKLKDVRKREIDRLELAGLALIQDGEQAVCVGAGSKRKPPRMRPGCPSLQSVMVVEHRGVRDPDDRALR